MKLKNAKIIIRSVSDIKKEWKQAFNGKIRSVRKEDEIMVSSFDTVDRLFSKNRLEILKTIINQKPASISELAQMINRDYKDVHSDVKFLSDAVHYRDWETDRKSTRLNSSHSGESRMPSSA